MKRKTKYYEYNSKGKQPLRIEMTEEKFLEVKNASDRWFISFGDCVLEVRKDEYDKYYKEREHTKYSRCDASGKTVHTVELDTLNVDHVHAVNPFTRLEEVSVEDQVTEKMMRIFLVKRLHKAMDTLSSDELSLLVNLFYFSKSQKEIAEELGITQQGVSKRLHMIIQKLRKAFSDLPN